VWMRDAPWEESEGLVSSFFRYHTRSDSGGYAMVCRRLVVREGALSIAVRRLEINLLGMKSSSHPCPSLQLALFPLNP